MGEMSSGADGTTENCADCDRETPHSVSVQILTESSKVKNAKFSREPYRVTECHICGVEVKRRMNDA